MALAHGTNLPEDLEKKRWIFPTSSAPRKQLHTTVFDDWRRGVVCPMKCFRAFLMHGRLSHLTAEVNNADDG